MGKCFAGHRFEGQLVVSRIKQPYQMLIADDDPGFRATLKAIFEPHFDTLEASSGEEVIEIVEFQPIDIALLDMHMDVLTGLDTLRILKTMNRLIPCILVTADASDELRRTASQADAYSVLSKPVSKSELLKTVSTAIEEVYDDPEASSWLVN